MFKRAPHILKNARFRQSAYDILKPMKGGKKTRGFTILETLIVLAVTGGLFVAIAATLSGRQQRTQFSQAVQEIQSQIQEVVNEVSSGYFPSSNNFKCVATLGGPSISSGSVGQGSNEGCIFLGKAIQFRVNGTDPEQFKIYTIAGLQRTTTGDEVTTLAEAMPKAVTAPASSVDITETKKLQYGLTTAWMVWSNSNVPIGTVAFTNSLASYDDAGIVSGSQKVRMAAVGASALNQTQAQAVQAINTQLQTAPIDHNQGIRICFASGGTNQSGLITIGNNNRQLSVTLSIKGNKTCA